MIDWRPIPSEVDTSQAPFDGDHVLLYADSATVDIVRLALWIDGERDPDDLGWWSYIHSVTREQISGAPGCNWSHWAPFNQPDEVEERYRQIYG